MSELSIKMEYTHTHIYEGEEGWEMGDIPQRVQSFVKPGEIHTHTHTHTNVYSEQCDVTKLLYV